MDAENSQDDDGDDDDDGHKRKNMVCIERSGVKRANQVGRSDEWMVGTTTSSMLAIVVAGGCICKMISQAWLERKS